MVRGLSSLSSVGWLAGVFGAAVIILAAMTSGHPSS